VKKSRIWIEAEKKGEHRVKSPPVKQENNRGVKGDLGRVKDGIRTLKDRRHTENSRRSVFAEASLLCHFDKNSKAEGYSPGGHAKGINQRKLRRVGDFKAIRKGWG